jgi:prevent-host-death family protein
VNVNVDDVMGVDKARSKFSELIDRLPAGGPFLITRNGEPAAVLIDPEDYEAMVATLEVLWRPGPAQPDRERAGGPGRRQG